MADRFQEALAALPGVQHAALASSLPTWTYGGSGNLIVEGRPLPERGREPLFLMNNVSPEYFETLGMKLVAGRHFTAADRNNSPRVIIISETTARTLWPGESALGKRLGAPGDTPNWREVVGVVNDIRAPAELGAPDSTFATYRPMAQVPVGYFTFALRTTVPPETLASAVRRAMATIDPDQPVHDIATVRTEIVRQLDNFTVAKWLLGGFASLGLVLAAVGIYSVIAGFVVQRTNEIGIRMALGAQLRDILVLVLGKGLRLVALGVLLGLGGAYAIARMLGSILPEVPAAESYTAVVVTAVLVGIATFACWLPARRATRVDPISALRAE
jgi:putative ABC transport system permease protein